MGGVKPLLLVDPNDLLTQPTAFLSPNVDALDFKAGKGPYIFEQDLVSAILEDDTETGNRAGDFFTWRLSATVRNVRLTVELLRVKLLNRRIHVVGTTRDGFQRLIPYMRLSAAGSTGRRATDRNGYSFSGVCRSIIPSLSIAAALDPLPGGGGGGSEGTTMTITTSSSTYTVEVPAGKLLKCIAVNCNTTEVINLGTSAAGVDILEGIPIQPPGVGAPGWPIIGENLFYSNTAQNLHFSGLQGTNTIILFFETV